MCGAVAGFMDVNVAPEVCETTIAPSCSLFASANSSNFADAFTILLPHSELSATQLFILIGQATPIWINRLMTLRNSIVKQIGLKDLGSLADLNSLDSASNAPFEPGQRIGIFSFVRATANELVVQDDDKHLLVQLALIKRQLSATQDELTLCTVVHTHNLLGRLYMLPVGPVHKRIVPAVLRKAPSLVARAMAQQTAATIAT